MYLLHKRIILDSFSYGLQRFGPFHTGSQNPLDIHMVPYHHLDPRLPPLFVSNACRFVRSGMGSYMRAPQQTCMCSRMQVIIA